MRGRRVGALLPVTVLPSAFLIKYPSFFWSIPTSNYRLTSSSVKQYIYLFIPYIYMYVHFIFRCPFI